MPAPWAVLQVLRHPSVGNLAMPVMGNEGDPGGCPPRVCACICAMSMGMLPCRVRPAAPESLIASTSEENGSRTRGNLRP